jgi:branched-chain amino acid transport system ATP-binding protein
VKPILKAEDLQVAFGGVIAADRVNLTVLADEVLAIVGSNGSGKTTFVNVCTGYIKPRRGEVYFGNTALSRLHPRAITRLGIARAFQIPQLFAEHTVLENLLLAAAARRGFWRPFSAISRPCYLEEAREALGLLGLEGCASQRAAQLSEGTRKLVDIAMALALRPRLLFMDEPTSGVSSDEAIVIMEAVMGALARAGITTVFVEHDMEMVRRYAHRVAVWENGRVVAQGQPHGILHDSQIRESIAGMA